VEEPHAELSLLVTVAVYVKVEPAAADWVGGAIETDGLFLEQVAPQSGSAESVFPSQSLSCPSEQAVSVGGVVAHV